MRWLLVALCACNQVYDLAPTRLLDAPPIDAPAECEDSALVFSKKVVQIVFRNCVDYTILGDRALALCERANNGPQALAEGPIDGRLEDVGGAPTRDQTTLQRPHLTPEGELIVMQQGYNFAPSVLSIYERGTGWTWKQDLPFAVNGAESAGAPSRGPQRHLMISRGAMVEEAVDDGNGNWTSTLRPMTTLGISGTMTPINLSHDGLRAVFSSGEQVRYAVRGDITLPFSGSYVLDVPAAVDPFLTEDCRRLYFSGIENVFYVQR